MVFFALVGAIAATVPQRATTSVDGIAAWKAAHSAFAPIVDLLGLDRAFSTWWFLATLALFALSLGIATTRMWRAALRRARGEDMSPRTHVPGLTFDEARERALALGYRSVRGGAGSGAATAIRLVRHRMGWWGSTVLHVGMLVVIVAGLVSAALTARAVVDLSQGEVWSPGDPFLAEETGPFAAPADPGHAIRFDSATTTAWPTGELKSLTIELSLATASGAWQPATTSVNRPLRANGHIIYASPGEFGPAGFVVLRGPGVPEARLRLEFPFVPRGSAGYTDIQPDGWPRIDARWDPDGVRGEKLLAMRLLDDAGTEHRVELDPAETGELGPYTAEFEIEGQWARLIVVRPVGVWLLFLGFAVIGIGSLMLYLWVPRELVLEHHPAGVQYSWRAARMPRSYAGERDEIIAPASQSAEE